MSIPRKTDVRSPRIAADAPAPEALAAAVVVHVGRTAVVLDARGGLLVPVTSAAHGLVPGGVCLAEGDGHLKVARRTPVGAALAREPWAARLRHARRVDLAVPRAAVDAGAAGALQAAALHVDAPGRGGPQDPLPARRAARSLVAAAGADDARRVHAVLRDLVGVGPGSTPSGDDVVVGVLAGLDRREDAAARRAAGVLRDALPGLLGRTTRLSRHALAAALRGQVAERVHHLVEATADVRRVDAVLRAARTWGATSGLDLAAGVAAGALGAPGAATVRTPAPLRDDLRRTA